jgi:hypothetical protein
MVYDEIMGTRLSTLEARMSALEQRLATIERTGPAVLKRRKKELTLEEKKAVRARLLAGQEKKRKAREAEIIAQAQSQGQTKGSIRKKAEAADGTSKTEK